MFCSTEQLAAGAATQRQRTQGGGEARFGTESLENDPKPRIHVFYVVAFHLAKTDHFRELLKIVS